MAPIVNDWIIVLAVLWEFLPTFSGFNLDTKIPIVKLGNPDSYFGFSVAQHFVYNHHRSISDSWLDFDFSITNLVLSRFIEIEDICSHHNERLLTADTMVQTGLILGESRKLAQLSISSVNQIRLKRI